MFRHALTAGAVLLAGAVFVVAAQAQPAATAAPDFSGLWQHREAPPPGPPGAQQLAGYEQRGSRGAGGVRQDPIPAIADLSDPLFRPETAAKLKEVVDKRIAGELILPARSLCWPNGVPGTIALGGNPMQILQTPTQVTIYHIEGPELRHIYLNVPHSEHVEPSWYGESVGHYEGDTLVVDTIGLNTHTVVDDFQTPHTEALHVVERYRLLEGGEAIEVTFAVEDQGAFTRPWTGAQNLRRVAEKAEFEEIYCAENNFDVLTGRPYPLPTATKLDF